MIVIIHNRKFYWYVKNLQGDIVAIKDSTGADIVRYTYDAWGKVSIQSDTSGCSLSINNPFLYRGYLYDREYNLYYLQSRYYDPELGRFLNADEPKLIGVGNPISNAYTYCYNEPINHIDSTGYLTWPGQIHAFVQYFMAAYILLNLKCYTYVNYFIRFSNFKYGFADLYAKKINEIWEVKPNKPRYYKSGPDQLKKYLDAIEGSKPGRDLGTHTTYFYFNGIYKVVITSNTGDGMIYYRHDRCYELNAAIVLAIGSIALIASGFGSGVGVAGLASAFSLVLV